MDPQPRAPEPQRQVPAVVWLILGALLVGVFAAIMVMLGHPPPVGPSDVSPAGAMIQAPPSRPAEAPKLE